MVNKPEVTRTKFVRVIYDYESPDWDFKSRTLQMPLSQAPAVYRYSETPENAPGDWRVDESPFKYFLYSLNNYNTNGDYDGLGLYRCENFLFKDDTALYNKKAFPQRQYLTMSGNKLEVIEWITVDGERYCKFKTLKPGDTVQAMVSVDAFEEFPQFVHRFNIVQMRDGVTITNPLVNRGGYLHYYLVSRNGYGFMPARFVKEVA